MFPPFRAVLLAFISVAVVTIAFPSRATAQNPAIATATLRTIHCEGLKSLTEPQVVALSGLSPGAPATKNDMQAAADKLVQTGLFASVKFTFQDRVDGLALTFHVEEAPRVPAYFDNFPWFADSELNDTIRNKLSFYDGSLPKVGAVVDQAADALNDFLVARDLHASVAHQVIADPVTDASVQQFHIEGATLNISTVEFSDPNLNSSREIQQKLSDLQGKPYSRMTIDLFLAEQVRPVYQQLGCLRAKLGPPEVRLTGNPNKKLPEQIPVYIPITAGPVYRWKNVEWTGNSALTAITLTRGVGLKPGDVANGMAIEAGWDWVREEYAHHGYLESKVDPSPTYDDHAHTVAYSVRVTEGQQYRFASMVITGLSPTAEKRLRAAWPIPEGQLFDKTLFEDFLVKLNTHREQIFQDLPLHYDTVGHWLQTDPGKSTVGVLLDFK